MWFDVAATSADKAAVEARDTAAQKMTAAQITRAKKLARECSLRKYRGCEDQNTLF